MNEFRDIDQKINESLKDFVTPFDDSSVQKAKANVMSRISLDTESKIQTISKKSNSYTWLRVAAVLVIVFGASIALYISGNQRVANTSNEHASAILPDGSEIILTTGSYAEFNEYSWLWNRSLRFSGEGYFDVSPGEKFTVETDGGTIEVLGTEFTLWADFDDLFVHCSQGSVKVSNLSGASILQHNEFLRVEDGLISPKTNYFVQGFITPRKDKILSFESVPVGVVISELEKVFGLDIKNGLASNLIYTGILDISDEKQCFEVFCKPFGAKFEKNAEGQVSIHL